MTGVTGVTFKWSTEREHAATPEAPYCSAHGEVTPAGAIAALTRIHRPAGK
jgi:hypothetical protein